MKRRHLLTASVIAAVGIYNTSAQATLYEQMWIIPGAWSISDTVDRSTGRLSYDSFTLSANAQVASVTWWGGNIDSWVPYDNPVDHDVLNWEIAIWTNDGGRPGELVSLENRPDIEVSRELVGTAIDPNVGELPYYRFDLALSSAVSLQADTTYWLSILAFSPTSNPWFHWMSGQDGADDSSITQNLGTGEFSLFFPNNRAFALDGSVIPLPPAVWLLASALAAISQIRRRPC